MPILQRKNSNRLLPYAGRGTAIKPFVVPSWASTTKKGQVQSRTAVVITKATALASRPNPQCSTPVHPKHSVDFLLNSPGLSPVQQPPLWKLSVAFLLSGSPQETEGHKNASPPDFQGSPQKHSVDYIVASPVTVHTPPTIDFHVGTPPLPEKASNKARKSPNSDSLYGPDEKGRWKVYRIVNKVVSGRRTLYKVVWYGSSPGRKPTTYEPRKHLIREGLKKEIMLIDRWVRKDRPYTLARFARKELPHGPVLTSSEMGVCAFEALNLPCVIQNHPEAATMEKATAFMAAIKSNCGRDLRAGADWKVIKEYAHFLKEAGSSLFYKKLEYNWLRESATRISIVKTIGLMDGYYIVGAYRADLVGHCFVLKVHNGNYTVCENGEEHEVEACGEWVAEVRFVRLVTFVQ